MKISLRQQRGISLLEVMLSLAIIAVILVMATRYFGIATKDARVNKATQEIGEIRQGYSRYQLDKGNIQGVTLAQLGSGGYITTQTAGGINPWGGQYVASTNDKTLQITAVPDPDCTNLANRFNTTCQNGSVTVSLLQ